MNTVFLRDSTAVSDSILLLFGGDISQGGLVSFIISIHFMENNSLQLVEHTRMFLLTFFMCSNYTCSFLFSHRMAT